MGHLVEATRRFSQAQDSAPEALISIIHPLSSCTSCCQVPMHLTAEQLRNVFDPYGAIEDVTIIYDKSTQQSKGAVIVISS